MKSRPHGFVLAFVVLVSTSAFAQTFTGGVRGAVRDAGGIIPGVTVQLVNEGTSQMRETVSNDQGEYNFGAVQPGNYTLKASLSGFKAYENRALRIGAQQFVTLDITLEVGQLQETITVTGQSPLIDTSNASTGAIINSRQLETLPTGGRSAFLFAVTIPTVIASGDPQFNRQQDQTNASLLSLGGGTRRGNNYLVDGVPVTDIVNRASANPTIEAIEEVNVQVHQYDAETGRTGGGTFNVATKSGTNDWHGSGFYQTRPKWGASNNFFSRLAGIPVPNTYFHLGGGGVGGPVVRNRTFFWFAMEGYGSDTTRNGNLRMPTSRELRGDFSESRDSAGRLVVIYDPLTGDPATGQGRTPFPNNVIPSNRLNSVAIKLASYLPTPDRDVSDGNPNRVRTAEIHDRAAMYTGKVDHRITDAVSLNGFYLYNKTDEPCANYWEPGLSGANRFADPGDYILVRRVNLLTLNNTWVPGNNTVVTLRYGWNRFIDNPTLSTDFDPSQLGFAPSLISALDVQKFPQIVATDYNNVDFGRMMGAIDPRNRKYYSWAANGTLSKLLGRHTLKFGVDYRVIGVDFRSFVEGAGSFRFDRFYTSANPNSNGVNFSATNPVPSGNAFASFLLGYPSGDLGSQSRIGKSVPVDMFTNYYGFYAQDDFRLNSKLTLNYGVRLEHESGLREKDDLFTVGFDRTLNPGGALGNVVNPLTGTRMIGGLIYAGQNGANEYQGDPPAIKFSPRIGVVYAVNPKTVVRAGYGTYWSPWNYQQPDNVNYGQIGASRQTFIGQGQYVPSVTLTNPFPGGVLPPVGNSLGALTGVGGEINFIDQNKRAPYVHMYSVDFSREVRGGIALGVEYSGATGRDLGLGGTLDGLVNINQVPSEQWSDPNLNQSIPNPFFGLPAGQGFNVTSATIVRRQLLRPFPQFGDIFMLQHTAGRNQYHAGIFKLDKRVSSGWGGRVNYTWSRLTDNQFGESNSYSRNSGWAADNYNLDGEYGIGFLDVPHKLVISPIVELPFGDGKRWATTGVGAAILGDWTISSIIAFESGFPISLSSNSNDLSGVGVRMQRVNPGAGSPKTSGSRDDRIAGQWLDPAAFVDPTGLVQGTLPRNLDDVRTPHRNNWDFVATKGVRIGGSTRAQIRLEVLNVTNTVKTHGPITAVGSTTFGQIRVQRGFMRLTQLAFRVSF